MFATRNRDDDDSAFLVPSLPRGQLNYLSKDQQGIGSAFIEPEGIQGAI